MDKELQNSHFHSLYPNTKQELSNERSAQLGADIRRENAYPVAKSQTLWPGMIT